MPQNPRQSRTSQNVPAAPPRRGRPRQRRVLIVDHEPHVAQMLGQCLSSEQAMLVHAITLAEARSYLNDNHVDVALIEDQLPDGDGFELARQVLSGKAPTQTILLAGRPSFNQAIEAMRIGAADLLIKPLDARELKDRVQGVMARQQRESAHYTRLRRLRRVCKKLNLMRQEVTQQVDILCNDLVSAYQDLASQMAQVSQTSEYGGLIKDELDLEKVLRRTLEYLIQKAGPTNAAIFLPSSLEEFTLGGYVNYDCDAESADVLLEHLADIVAPKISERDGLLHITDNATLMDWIGDDAAYFEDSHVLGFACKQEGETLAVLALFRDAAEPFSDEVVEICDTIGTVLAQYLARIIRIHHRHLGGMGFGDEDEGALPF